MKAKNFENKLIMAASLCFAAAMVVFPAVTESGSKTAIIIWANSIVPILLPFFIFADFIKRTGNPEMLPRRIYPFVIAFLSGYPVGAKAVGDLVSAGRLSYHEAKSVLSYSMVTGPAFIIGTIGTFLGNYKAALVVALAHYIGAGLNGMLYRAPESSRKPRQTSPAATSSRIAATSGTPLENFTAAISAGFKAMAIILAYLILFMIAIDLMEAAGAFELIKNETLSSVAKGLLEMTVGSNMVAICDINIRLKTVLISFIVSFGGLSVIGQSISMTAGSGISGGSILKIKLTHGIFAGIIAVILSWVML